MYQFAQPVSGGWLKPAEANGHLLLILAVHDVREQPDQYRGTAEVARFDFVDLDGDGSVCEQFQCSNPGIVRKLASVSGRGQMMLGRIGQVPTDKGSPAWVLTPFEAGVDDKRAAAWLERNSPPFAGAGTPPEPKAAAPAAAAATAAPPTQMPGGETVTPEMAELLRQVMANGQPQ